MKAALVIMAAGLGSRYGGNKQVDGVGPNGEALMEYAIYDAIRSGFTKIVLIVKPEIVGLVDRLCGAWLKTAKTREGEPVEVSYVFQTYDSIPSFYAIPSQRTKPFGTVHAVLCAKDCVQEPFCVINADDYYGVEVYHTMYEALQTMEKTGQAAMAGYLLEDTVSENGAVTRGICLRENGLLREIRETAEIRVLEDGSIADTSGDVAVPLNPETIVSMNFWGFQPSIFPVMEQYFHDFLRRLAPEEKKAECLLPVMVGDLVNRGELQVQVLPADGRWFGMTYQEDRRTVAQELQKYHQCGVYPPALQL